MKEMLEKIKAEAAARLSEKNADLEALRVQYLGKKGELTSVLRGMGQLSAEERPKVGQMANEVRAYIEQLIENVFVTKVHVVFQAVKLREEAEIAADEIKKQKAARGERKGEKPEKPAEGGEQPAARRRRKSEQE